jgi:hypothetical protein
MDRKRGKSRKEAMKEQGRRGRKGRKSRIYLHKILG